MMAGDFGPAIENDGFDSADYSVGMEMCYQADDAMELMKGCIWWSMWQACVWTQKGKNGHPDYWPYVGYWLH